MNFKATKDTLVISITLGVICLFAFIGYQSLICIIDDNGNTSTLILHSCIIFSLLMILLVSYLFAPNKYSINDSSLIISRPVGKKIIDLNSIKEVELIEKSDIKNLTRTFGVGGLFGIYGKFYSKKFGDIIIYGTQNRNYVGIKTQNKKILITPNNLDIVKHLKKKACL